MPHRRLFTEQEVSEIMLQAAELQENAPNAPRTYEPGITEEELHKLAAEFGISAEFLEMALAKVQEQPPPKYGTKVLGVPYRVEHERIVDGELSPEDFDILLDELPENANLGLIPTQVGRTLTVKNPRNPGAFELICRSGRGRTRIRTRTSNFIPAFATFYPASLISLFAILGTAKEGMPLVGVLVALGAFTIAGSIFRPWARYANERSRKMADRIQDAVAKIAKQVETETAEAPEWAASDLQTRLNRNG